jgi:hypothetical protein
MLSDSHTSLHPAARMDTLETFAVQCNHSEASMVQASRKDTMVDIPDSLVTLSKVIAGFRAIERLRLDKASCGCSICSFALVHQPTWMQADPSANEQNDHVRVTCNRFRYLLMAACSTDAGAVPAILLLLLL